MTHYLVVIANIPEMTPALAKYSEAVHALVHRSGGRYVMLGGPDELLEGQWPEAQRLIVSAWDTRQVVLWVYTGLPSPMGCQFTSVRVPVGGGKRPGLILASEQCQCLAGLESGLTPGGMFQMLFIGQAENVQVVDSRLVARGPFSYQRAGSGLVGGW